MTKNNCNKRAVSSIRKTKKLDTAVIKQNLLTMDSETVKRALIASGIYDNNMKLTASFR